VGGGGGGPAPPPPPPPPPTPNPQSPIPSNIFNIASIYINNSQYNLLFFI